MAYVDMKKEAMVAEATDNGVPSLTRYQRVIITVKDE